MEKKGYYREFYPGYMGHIPYKYEVIGMTVGATNSHIKSLLRKEPDYEKTFVPFVILNIQYDDFRTRQRREILKIGSL